MSIKLASDQELIDLYLDGNESGIEILINRYKDHVLGYIRIRIRDNDLAEDIFQETFIKVINSIRLDCYKDQGRFLAWVYRIAHNLMCDHWKKDKRMRFVKNDDEVDVFETIKSYDVPLEEVIVTEQIHSDLRKLIKLLPGEQQEIIMMRHYFGLTFSEIAEELNENLNTVIGRMRYALKKLRKLIKEKDLILKY